MTRGSVCVCVQEMKSDVTHHHPYHLPAFSSMPPSPAQLVLLARAWHGAPCPRHARFVAFDDGRCHRTLLRGA
jgi:hypothetical protein